MFKKSVKENLSIVLVVTIIAVIAALLLGVVNKFTAIDESKVLQEKISKIYDSPIAQTLDIKDYTDNVNAQILNAFKCEDGAIIVHSKSKKAYNAKGIELLVVIKDNILIKATKYSHSETPGLGSKALEESNLNKFANLDLSKYASVSIKESADNIYKVDGVTSATFSSNGVTIAINNAIAFYKSI